MFRFNRTFRRRRLFGITIRQAYQYYSTNVNDTLFRKSLVRCYSSIDSVVICKVCFELIGCYHLVSSLTLEYVCFTWTWTRLSYSSLDLLNFIFGAYMVYCFILLLIGYTDRGPLVLWCVCSFFHEIWLGVECFWCRSLRVNIIWTSISTLIPFLSQGIGRDSGTKNPRSIWTSVKTSVLF